MHAVSHIVEDIQPAIFGGPLSIRLVSDQAFGGSVPGPEDIFEELKQFIEDVLLYPPWSQPPGQLIFVGRRFHYKSIPYWEQRARWTRRRLKFWASNEAAGYLEECWIEEFGDLFEEVEQPPAPLQLVAPVALKIEKPALWDESRMAEAMGLTETELHARLEAGRYDYKYTHRQEDWQRATDGRRLNLVGNKYLFGPVQQRWNEKRVNKFKKIQEDTGGGIEE